MDIIIQEFEDGITYVANGENIEEASKNLELAMLCAKGCLHMLNEAKTRELVYYGTALASGQLSDDLLRTLCTALGLSVDAFYDFIKNKNGGEPCL